MKLLRFLDSASGPNGTFGLLDGGEVVHLEGLFEPSFPDWPSAMASFALLHPPLREQGAMGSAEPAQPHSALLSGGWRRAPVGSGTWP